MLPTQAWPHIRFYLFDNLDYNRILKWCEDQFGERWHYYNNTFYFETSEDLTLFVMRWK